MPMKSVSFPPTLNSISQTLQLVGPLSGATLPSQTINGRVIIQGEAQAQIFTTQQHSGGKEEKRLIHVDLNNSEIGAPGNMLDKNDMRGLYVEWVEYRIWLQRFGETQNPDTPIDGWSIFDESPNTSNSSGSVTSSINWGLNASVGTFGPTPTANVGANLGVSTSHSHSLTDFTFVQLSTGKVLHHKVYLSQCADGEPYLNSSSLIDQWQSPLVGVRLRPLPALAKSNVPLVGQAVWMNENDSALYNRVTVFVAVTPHWCLVEGMNDGLLHRQTTAYGGTYVYSVDVDFTDIGASDLSITSATYGANGTSADVSSAVNARIVGSRLSMPVTNATMGGDPVPNVAKKLHVLYSYKGKNGDVTVNEGGQLSIGA